MANINLRKNKIITILTLVLAFGLLIYRINDELGNEIQKLFIKVNNLNDKIPIDESDNMGVDNSEADISLIEINEEFFNSMSEKELIHYKMINSIDFFNTVEGKIEFNNMMIGGMINYIIDVKNNRSRSHSEGDNGNLDTIFNNDVRIEFDNESKTYRDIRVTSLDKEKSDNYRKLKPKKRYYVRDGSGTMSQFLTRKPDLMGYTACSIIGTEGVTQYLQNYDAWDIVGEEEFVGRTCKKIVGDMGFEDTKSKANNFVALLDAETGVVLKLERMTSDGTIVSGFETKYIKYNETYDEEIFDTSIEGYTPKYP